MKYLSIFKDYYHFLRAEKKFWMLPIIFIIVLIGLLVIALESSAVAPFIYTIF